MGLVVADFFVHASVSSTELCLEDTVANAKGISKKGGTKSEVATSPLPSRGPTSGRKCCVTLAFSGVPNAKRGVKIRSGCLTPAFSGGPKKVGIAT